MLHALDTHVFDGKEQIRAAPPSDSILLITMEAAFELRLPGIVWQFTPIAQNRSVDKSHADGLGPDPPEARKSEILAEA
jgi:hypothetical protein